MTSVRLEPTALRSRVKHSTIEPLRSLLLSMINRGSYMNAPVSLNVSNELEKRDKMRGLLSILSLFRNKFNDFNNTGAQMLYSIYHMH